MWCGYGRLLFLFVNIQEVPGHATQVDCRLNFIDSIVFNFCFRNAIWAAECYVPAEREQTECDAEEQCELDGPLFHFVTVL